MHHQSTSSCLRSHSHDFPISLLWAVRFNLRTKLELLAVMSLTMFTMLVSIVRVTMTRHRLGEVEEEIRNFYSADKKNNHARK